MSAVTIYHNPRCSKSRQALALLQQRGVEPQVIRYLDTPPTAAELELLLAKLGLEPQDIVRKGEPQYAALGLANASRDELIRAMVAHPILIERPIVVVGNKAVVGRPVERVIEVL